MRGCKCTPSYQCRSATHEDFLYQKSFMVVDSYMEIEKLLGNVEVNVCRLCELITLQVPRAC